MIILGIESSCDETAAALVEAGEDGRRILSSAVASQIPLHAVYGGVVPEIASRAHCEAISGLVRTALDDGGLSPDKIDAVAVTTHPGLIGALLVGVNFAKGFAYANQKPLLSVDHVMGHIAANALAHPDLEPPFLALVASGGHTSIIRVDSWCERETVGRTRDDAIGEAFDKVARVMGIPYPGGAEMDRLSFLGNRDYLKLPSAAIADGSLDFSFSGIKTAVINELHRREQKNEPYAKEDVAASFSRAVCDSVEKKIAAALDRTGMKTFVFAGGVSANRALRERLEALCHKKGVRFYAPPKELCGDNGAMIAMQGYFEYLAGRRADTSLNASAAD